MNKYRALTEPILVGGKLVNLSDICMEGIEPSSFSTSEIMATSCRSLLINSHGVRGTLYRVDEHLLIQGDGEEVVIQAMEYFAFLYSNKCYSFVKGKLFQSRVQRKFVCHTHNKKDGVFFLLHFTEADALSRPRKY